MIENIIIDIMEFSLVLFILLCMFTNVLYFRHSGEHAPDITLHDDEASHPFDQMQSAFHSTFLLGFVGDFDGNAFPYKGDKMILDMFIMIINVVMLNVLIAIVSDSYDTAIAKSYGLFWFERLSVVLETTTIFGWTFKDTNVDYRTILKTTKLHLGGSNMRYHKMGRIQHIERRVAQNTDRKFEEMENIMDMAELRTNAKIDRLERKIDLLVEGLRDLKKGGV